MALSDDLRKRVVEAVVLDGLSRNVAAKRFEVSIASAVRWVMRFQTTGAVSPAPCGGDRRSDRIEAHGDYLLGLIRRKPDIALIEVQDKLIVNCGERFSLSVLWRFFDRHDITFKKKRRMPKSSNGPMCWSDAGNGSLGNSISIPRNSFSSTRPEPPQISRAKADGVGAGDGCASASRTATTKR